MDFELLIIDPITQEERVATPDDDLRPGQPMKLRAVDPEDMKEGGRYWRIGKLPTLDMGSADTEDEGWGPGDEPECIGEV